MTSHDAESDAEWGKLAELGEAEREGQMAARYAALAALSEEERQGQVRAMLNAEYAHPEEKRRSFAESRIRTLLNLDLEVARTVARSYDVVMNRMSAGVAMQHVGVIQTIAREFSIEDQARLRALFPEVFGDRARVGFQHATSAPTQPAQVAAKKPWWAFWKS